MKSEVKSHWATYDRQELCGALHGTAGVASSAQDGLSDMVWNTFCIEFSPPWHEMTHMATVKPHAVGVETVSVPRRHHRCREPACKSESKSFSTAQGNDIFCFCVRSFCLRLSHFVPFVCVKVCMYSSVWECCFVLRCVSAAYLLSRSISLFSRSLSLSLCGCLALSRSLSLSVCDPHFHVTFSCSHDMITSLTQEQAPLPAVLRCRCGFSAGIHTASGPLHSLLRCTVPSSTSVLISGASADAARDAQQAEGRVDGVALPCRLQAFLQDVLQKQKSNNSVQPVQVST